MFRQQKSVFASQDAPSTHIRTRLLSLSVDKADTWGVCVCVCPLTQSCPTLCDPIDCSQWGSSVHEIFQAGILEQVAISSSRWSAQPRDQTCISRVSCTAGGFCTCWAIGEAPVYFIHSINSIYVSILTSQFLPPLLPLVSIHLFSTSLSLFLLCK